VRKPADSIQTLEKARRTAAPFRIFYQEVLSIMKRILQITALTIAAALCLALAACGGGSSSSTAEAHTVQDYVDAIKNARSDEDNEYDAIVAREGDGAPTFAHNPSDLTDEIAAEQIPFMLEVLGVTDDALDAYAFSMSLMNVRAYAIGVFRPAEGQADTVKTGLEEYVKLQQQSFEQYLQDQYEIAKSAKVETLPGGEIVIVMAEDGENILTKIKEAL